MNSLKEGVGPVLSIRGGSMSEGRVPKEEASEPDFLALQEFLISTRESGTPLSLSSSQVP